MNAFGKLVCSVNDALEFNHATLSGCVDIVVVQQQDGSLKSSPFHARFGKLKVLKSRDKVVKIHVNGCEAGFVMKLGEAGEAFFEDRVERSMLKSKKAANSPLILPDVEASQVKTIKSNVGSNNLKAMLQMGNSRSNQSTSAQTNALMNDNTLSNQMEIEDQADMKDLCFLNENMPVGYQKIEAKREQTKKIKVKTLRPSSERLQSLNLKWGINTITYTVQSGLQGSQSLSGHIYFWPMDANIIVSDIDGTITKSDVLGHILSMFGKDWSQPGIASLYTNIRRNGYHILYLTSRPIGQACQTKAFLDSVCQDGHMLPMGPVLTSPDRSVSSVKREMVYKRPDLFKVAALRDIRSLFPADHNPFHAGFGNRETDAISYRAVGIPLEKVFIVNPSGDIHHHNSISAKSYALINTMLKEIFPGITKDSKAKLAESLNDSNILRLDNESAIEANAVKVVS